MLQIFNRPLLKKILKLLALSFSLGVVIGTFIYVSSRFYFHTTFTLALGGSIIIGGVMSIATYFFYKLNINQWLNYLGLTIASFVSTLLIAYFALVIFPWAFSSGIAQFLQRYGLPCFLLSFGIGLAALRILKPAQPSPQKEIKFFSFRSDKKWYKLELEKIRYFASFQNKTVLYTLNKEYEISKLLKELESELPNQFLRIHKGYLLNLNKLSHIEYAAGGSYLAYLKGDESFTLPVGRKYATNLKQVLT